MRLARALPRRGRKRFADGSQAFVPMKEILPGDILIICMGEKIVLDGTIIEGEGTCDESLLTGEVLPVSKKIGMGVLGGSFLQSGWIAIRATAAADQSLLHTMISSVEEDVSHKTSYQRAADALMPWFVPGVIVLAMALGLSSLAFNGTLETATLRTMLVLLIACPCAIGIAAPLAEAHLLNRLMALGAIVKNRGCLALLGRESVFIFDKTGTLTEGHFRVLEGLQNLQEEQLSILRGLCLQSTHAIACAIAQSIASPLLLLDRIEEKAGRGLQGTYEGQRYYLGSALFLEQNGIKAPSIPFSALQSQIITPVFFGSERGWLTTLLLGDQIREDAPSTIAALAPHPHFLCREILNPPFKPLLKLAGFRPGMPPVIRCRSGNLWSRCGQKEISCVC